MDTITVTIKKDIAHYWLEEANKEKTFWESQIKGKAMVVPKTEAEQMLADWKVVIETLKQALQA
jgi:hypothetical protein